MNALTKAVNGSLTDIATKNNISLAETFMDAEIVVLVDSSGSMYATDAPGNKSRYQAACDQLQALQAKYPGKLAVISFNSFPMFCPHGLPEEPQGSTNMVAALEFVMPVDGTGTKIVLTSDGEPDEEGATLAAARRFRTKIDVIFVGPEYPAHGRDFLMRLAQATGGSFFKSDQPGFLGEGVEKLLLTG